MNKFPPIFEQLGERFRECGIKSEQVLNIPASIIHAFLSGDLTLIAVWNPYEKQTSFGFSAARREGLEKWAEVKK